MILFLLRSIQFFLFFHLFCIIKIYYHFLGATFPAPPFLTLLENDVNYVKYLHVLLNIICSMLTFIHMLEFQLSRNASLWSILTNFCIVLIQTINNLESWILNIGGAAERAGLRAGDRIMRLNGLNVKKKTHDELVELLKGSGSTPTLVVETGPSYPPQVKHHLGSFSRWMNRLIDWLMDEWIGGLIDGWIGGLIDGLMVWINDGLIWLID